MGHEWKMTIESTTGVPTNTASRLSRDFLLRHGAELDDLLRRFPSASEKEFHAAIERHACEGASNVNRQAIMTPYRHPIVGPTQFLWRLSCRMLKARQEQIDVCGAIHLSFQQFQPVELTLCLAVGPRLTKRCGNRVEIGREAARK